MKNKLIIALAQLNLLVGDIEGNAKKIIAYAERARDELHADVIVFPELAITGYPPEDLLFRPALYDRVHKALAFIQQVQDIIIIVGYPDQVDDKNYNAAAVIHNGQIIARYFKQYLPNYGVFDEVRYFTPAHEPCIIDLKGIPTAITICEDLWFPEPMTQASDHGARLMILLNASPFSIVKQIKREETIAQRAKEGYMPIIYVNLVGGQDELVFDGGSMVFDADGTLCQQAAFFEEALMPITIDIDGFPVIEKNKMIPTHSFAQRVYQALVLGVRDYIEKNHFPGAIVGLSGGIDSALTAAIAVDAIGKDRVAAIMMPSRYTANISNTMAQQEIDALGINAETISIEPIFQQFIDSLAECFTGLPVDVTEENLQARIRGTLLMAISNKKGSIVLATGNKSEMAVGYSTLYGDMVGGFCVLKDIPKTLVYRLAEYRNTVSPVIPREVIDRPPSAELAPDQKDQDSLPPYPILDDILERYIEYDQSYQTITDAGFDEEIVKRVIKMVNRNEYKRRQAPIGVRITQRAFGRDRRYPITSGFGLIFDK